MGAAAEGNVDCGAGIARTLGSAAAGGAAAEACGVTAVIGDAGAGAAGGDIGWIDYATTY